MLFVVGNRLRQVRFDSEKLSPEQWARIVELSGPIVELNGLPGKAKPELEDYIGFYRALRNDARKQYPGVAGRVQAVKAREEQTLRDLTQLISSREFFPAIAMGIEHQLPVFDEELELIREWLKQACEQKRELLDWYDKALKRLHRSTTRVPSSLFNLVRLLNRLLQKYTGRRISSGKNDPAFKYVLEACKIAEPELLTKKGEGVSTLHEITKRVVTETTEGELFTFDMEAWGHLIPYWVPTKDVSIHDPERKIKIEYHEEPDGGFTSSSKMPEIEGEGTVFILHPLFAPENQR